jgi:hypothetical protein
MMEAWSILNVMPPTEWGCFAQWFSAQMTASFPLLVSFLVSLQQMKLAASS